MSNSWHPVIAESEFPQDEKLATRVGGWHVLIARQDGDFHAVNDRCTHQAALLSAGKIRRGTVICPLHGARFEMASGKCLGGTYRDLRTFALRVIEGVIEVAVPDATPGMEDLPVST